jgi:GNAT superfamily N-acetyltransferase
MTRKIRPAVLSDVDSIVDLVNAAYRSDESKGCWTTEAHLISGYRTGRDEVTRLISKAQSTVLLGWDSSQLIASVHVERSPKGAYLGMLAVLPSKQGKGLGGWMLTAGEQYAKTMWEAKQIVISVVAQRYELVHFYERKGYAKTGDVVAYPSGGQFGVPKVQDLTVETLVKEV